MYSSRCMMSHHDTVYARTPDLFCKYLYYYLAGLSPQQPSGSNYKPFDHHPSSVTFMPATPLLKKWDGKICHISDNKKKPSDFLICLMFSHVASALAVQHLLSMLTLTTFQAPQTSTCETTTY